MADDVPVTSAKSQENDSSDDENTSGPKITVHVKTPKDKETFEVPENMLIKDVSV